MKENCGTKNTDEGYEKNPCLDPWADFQRNFHFSVAACPVTIFVLKLDRTKEQMPFGLEGWNSPMNSTDGVSTGTRLKMVDDLLTRYDFHEWKIDDTQQFLGKAKWHEWEGQKASCHL